MTGYRSSVRIRLLVSFGAIAAAAVLAGVVGVVAFANSWGAIDHITRTNLSTLTTAHQLAQQSKSIAATAPLLLAAKVQSQRLTAREQIFDQMDWLEELVGRLRDDGVGSMTMIEREKDRLLQSFATLDGLVETHIGARTAREATVREIEASLDAFTAALGRGNQAGPGGPAKLPDVVYALSITIANSLLAAANSPRPEQLEELEQRFHVSARRLEEMLPTVPGGIDPRIRESIERMLWFGNRPGNLFQIRKREIETGAAAQRMLYIYNHNASRLVLAANEVIDSVRADVAEATEKARTDLLFNGVFLIVIALVCVIGAVIASIHIGRNIGNRLAALQTSMETHAAGGTPEIPSDGQDEITEIAGALRSFIDTIDHHEKGLRESAESLANAQRIAGIGNWEWNLETGEMRRSAEMCRLIGVESGEGNLPRQAMLERVHPDDREGANDVIKAALETGEPFSLQFRIILPDGVERVLHEQGEVTLDDDLPLIMTGTTQDITDRKRSEEALIQSEQALHARVAELEDARRKLERQGADLAGLANDLSIARDHAEDASSAKSEFLAAMSHELRTPLNAVIGFSEIIRSETFGAVGSDKYREYANDINESGQHLLDLINDILDLSKIESGKEDIHEDVIEVSTLIGRVMTLVKEHAYKEGVALHSDCADGLPLLRADDRKVKQILLNLLSNAIKFTEAGGRVELRSWYGAGEGHAFRISDTGIGIAEADIPRAMTPFRQIDDPLNRKYEGTGLGLPLAKSLVEMHGGSLELESEPGAGTTITVRFPTERAISEPESPSASAS